MDLDLFDDRNIKAEDISELISEHTLYAQNLSKRWWKQGVQFEERNSDITQVCLLALVECAQSRKWNPYRGTFKSYMYGWLKKAVYNYIQKEEDLVRLPETIHKSNRIARREDQETETVQVFDWDELFNEEE